MSTFVPVLAVLARVQMAFSLAFLVPLSWARFHDTERVQWVWFGSFLLTLGMGVALWLATRQRRRELLARDGFLLVNLVWVLLPAYAALPLMFTVPGISWTRAYFEAMSALTATGATALSGLDALPVATNIWRCFLQLIGGLGIMLLVVAILPLLGLGGVQLYKAETPGPMKDTKFTPRIAETARGLWGVYFVLSITCLLSYRWGGMSWDDAFMHMCTTVGLGGLSSHDQSFGYWNSPTLEWLAVLYMSLAGISFARYFMVWRTRSLRPLWRDAEVRAYVLVLLAAIVVVWGILLRQGQHVDAGHALRDAAFQVVSVATTTGYATTDYLLWPTFVPVLMLLLGGIVSCAGSTGGGIKMVRVLILAKVASHELVRLIHPRVINPVTLGGMTVPGRVIGAVIAYMLAYGATLVGLSLLMLASGLDVVTAFSAVVACLNNVGPGMGKVGPASNYAVLTDFQIWLCSLAMMLGRLELLSVMVLFTPQFWRR
ncbi:MAG TPA: potassium transporter TrkG [Ottowia sp.]|nr:potassium transporter TrkG [Ottowia sp.]